MTTSVQDLSVPGYLSKDEDECRTKLCDRCKNVPFDEGSFAGFAAGSDRGSLVLYPNQLHNSDKFGQYDLKVDFELVDNWPQLPVIAQSGEKCDFCKLLEMRLRKTDLPSLESRHASIRVELFYCWRHKEVLSLTGLKALVWGKLEGVNGFTRLVWLQFAIDADEGECKRWLRMRQRPASDILNGVNVTEITTRLRGLDNRRKSTFLPTRLIDLGCHDQPSDFVRLVTKEEAYNEQGTYPMYVALSYPWGPPKEAAYQSKTTLENIHNRRMAIDLQTVSKVIQDAAIVCKLLGVRYLWVDALCIIQGDIQDWERESTKMGNIFRNAYLTIGAAAIESCHGSFLSPNLDTLEIPFKSRIEPNVKGVYRLVAWKNEPGKYLILFGSDFLGDFSGPWEDRGWVLQEVAMSTRLLKFGRTTVALEIMEKGCQELSSGFNVFENEVDHRSWRELAVVYSGQQLTFEKDTFPAISGLARFFAEHLEDQYLAGIWKSDLCISLYWYHPPAAVSERRGFFASINTIAFRPYIAPSWSWAAEKYYMEFGTFGFYPHQFWFPPTPEYNVIDADCTVEGLDPFGTVQSGYIVFSAKVLRLEIGEFSFTPTPDCPVGNYDWYLAGKTRVMRVFLDGDPERDDPDIHRVLFMLLASFDDSKLDGDGESLSDESADGEKSAYGLVLYPALGENTFYRVGLFNSQVRNHAPDGGLKLCDNWKTEEITII